MVGVLVTNLIAATQDIATDGLAVDLLEHHERCLGSGAGLGARDGAGGTTAQVLGGVLSSGAVAIAWRGPARVEPP